MAILNHPRKYISIIKIKIMKMSYSSGVVRQFMAGFVSFLTAAIVTYIFDHEVKWALALAIGLGTFVTSGFYVNEK